ncbi:MAG: NAD-dependent epimerase/dehydratase family protein [Anaerolineae bacterium]
MDDKTQNPLHQDLDYILDHTKDVWEDLRAQRVFITGGTGFFGCWLLESFLWANERLELGASATVLTRSPESFRKKAPHLATAPSVTLHQGDIRDFDFPQGHFSHIIHAATEANAALNDQNPLLMFDTIVQGTRHALDFAVQCGAKKFLLTSSGAVYGKQPPDMTHIPESYTGAPDPLDPPSAYGEGKRAAELLCAIYSSKHELECKIARCFAFVGPYLSIDAPLAISSFLHDGLVGRAIRVRGNPQTIRAYQYAGDLAIWLWTLLFSGAPGRSYNVGSESEITIGELAHVVANSFMPARKVIIEAANAILPGRYIPSTARTKKELGLTNSVSLSEGIAKMLAWHRQAGLILREHGL